MSNNRAFLISIITVCRNDSMRLKVTLDSLGLYYGDPRFEHVVIDGGSSDGTFKLIEPLLKEKNFKFKSANDSGIYDAMNQGAFEAQAPLLLFLNCGDTITASPDEVFRSFLHLKKEDGTAALDIACFPILQVGIRSSRLCQPKRLTRHKMPASHQAMLFSRNFVVQNKYQIPYKIAGDYDLYLRAETVGYAYDPSDPTRSFVSVEVDGVASKNSLNSYLEYISIANARLHGFSRFVALVKIIIRSVIVIAIKSIVPARWITAIRGV